MSLLQHAAAIPVGDTGFNISNSLKMESDNNEHLYRAMVAGNRKTWTYSCWIKRTELLQTNSQVLIHFGVNHQATRMFIDDTNDQLYLDVCSTANELYRSITNKRFRDTSAWYHIVWRMDTTQGTAANRMRLYINGVEETSWSQHQLPPQNYETLANTTAGGYDDMGIGTFVWAGSNYDGLFSGYIAQVAHVDGQSYAPTEFGEVDDDSGIWKPKDVSGLTYGSSNNSFFLDFETSSNLGTNAKGNGVNFSLTNIAAADQATDTPTNNFCTLSILNGVNNGGGNVQYTEGATKAKALQGSEPASGSMAVTKGKWYYECKAVTNPNIMAGWGVPNSWGIHSENPGYDTFSFAVHDIGRVYYYGNSFIDLSPSVEFGTSDIVSVALDADNGFAYWAKNGTYMNGGNPTSGSTGTGAFNYIGGSTGANIEIVAGDFLVPALRANQITNGSILLNFGGYTTISISSAASDADGYGTFEYAPPSGYYSLCTKNLAKYG